MGDPLADPVELLAAPDVDMSDEEVEAAQFRYDDRHPTDFLVSGPVGDEGVGRGRWFPTDAAAERWVADKYGNRVRRRAPENEMEGLRWAYLIRAASPS